MNRYFAVDRATEVSALRAAQKTGAFPKIRRDFAVEIKAIDDSRALDFTISTDSVDRYGDTVAVGGWKLESFRKNPVVLWMHDNTMLPVGRAVNVRVEDGKLKSRVDFTPEKMATFNDIVFDMLKGGFLNATSVGFMPLKYAFVDDPSRRFGIDFEEQELLEFSIVTVPANPEALIEGRSVDAPVPEVDPTLSVEFARRRVSVLNAA